MNNIEIKEKVEGLSRYVFHKNREKVKDAIIAIITNDEEFISKILQRGEEYLVKELESANGKTPFDEYDNLVEKLMQKSEFKVALLTDINISTKTKVENKEDVKVEEKPVEKVGDKSNNINELKNTINSIFKDFKEENKEKEIPTSTINSSNSSSVSNLKIVNSKSEVYASSEFIANMKMFIANMKMFIYAPSDKSKDFMTVSDVKSITKDNEDILTYCESKGVFKFDENSNLYKFDLLKFNELVKIVFNK